MPNHHYIPDSHFKVTFVPKKGGVKYKVETAHIIERLSALYQINVTFFADDAEIDFKSLIAQTATLKVEYLEDKVRYFTGIVGNVRQKITKDVMDLTIYEVTIYPYFWMLTFNQDYKIFQSKSACKIIKEVLSAYPDMEDFENHSASHGTTGRKYCVQYGESDFHFVSRLLAEEGICYYFNHLEKSAPFLITDALTTFKPMEPGRIKLNLTQTSDLLLDRVTQFHLEQRVIPQASSLADYDFVAPNNKLYAMTAGSGEGGIMYSYPGRFFKIETGKDLNSDKMEFHEWDRKLVYGESTAPAMSPGFTFILEDHPREDANQQYSIYEVEHFIDTRNIGKSIYYNKFTAIPPEVAYRPDPIPKPRIYSNQIAIVVGKESEEIWTDEYGRIKVQFYWDQYGKNDEKSSCWIRVAQMWAGAGWGSMFIPRIGMEVVVSFLEGDPDRPLVVGCVYNNNNMPPYPLPDECTKSTIHTQSTKQSKDYNELRFEDKKDSEEVYVRAQKDFNREVMKGDRTLIIHEGNDKSVISKGNHYWEHTASGDSPPTHELHMIKGDHLINLDKGNQTITLLEGDETFELKKGNQTTTLTKGDQTVTLKKGNQTITLNDGNMSLTLDKGNGSFTFKDGDYTITASNNAVTVKAKNITLEASDTLTLKGGKVQMESTQTTIAMKASTALNAEATTDMSLKGGNIKMESTMTEVSIKATTDFKVKANVEVNIEASAMGTVKLGAMGTVKSDGMMTVEASGMTKVKGAMVMIGS